VKLLKKTKILNSKKKKLKKKKKKKKNSQHCSIHLTLSSYEPLQVSKCQLLAHPQR